MMKMRNVYNQLMMVIDEERMAQDGIYLTYYESTNVVAEDWGMEGYRGDFEEYFYEKFGVDLEEIEGTDFIAFDDNGAINGNVYVNPEVDFEEITHYMLSESDYKKYVDKDEVVEIRGY